MDNESTAVWVEVLSLVRSSVAMVSGFRVLLEESWARRRGRESQRGESLLAWTRPCGELEYGS